MTIDHPARRENPYETDSLRYASRLTGFDGERDLLRDLLINIGEALRKIA